MLDTAAGSVVKVFISVAASWLAVAGGLLGEGDMRLVREAVAAGPGRSFVAGVSLRLAGGLLGEGDMWLVREAVAAGPGRSSVAGVSLGLARGILVAAVPAGMEEGEEGAEEEAGALEFIPEIGTALPFPPPITQPGTRSLAVAGAGPSVTATQPGKFRNKLPGSTFSLGRGFFAAHWFITSFV